LTAAGINGSMTTGGTTLIVILDDATSEIYYAPLVEEESTRTAMAGLRDVIGNKDPSARYTATGEVISL
jgi:hypothetical protein